MQQDESPDPKRTRGPDYTGWIILAVVLLVIGICVVGFPAFKSMVNTQDCMASGRTDCLR